MRFLLLKDLIHPLKNLPSRFRGPHPTFEPFLSNFYMAEPEPPKLLLLKRCHLYSNYYSVHRIVNAYQQYYNSCPIFNFRLSSLSLKFLTMIMYDEPCSLFDSLCTYLQLVQI